MKITFKKIIDNIFFKLVLGLFFILGIGYLSYYLYVEFWVYNQCRGNETSVVYTNAAADIKKYSTLDFESMEQEIKKHRNYDKDANCLYPLFERRVYLNDEFEAKQIYRKIEKAYDKEVKFADAYQEFGIESLSDVEEKLKILEDRDANGKILLFD